jgi:hypothetical protein
MHIKMKKLSNTSPAICVIFNKMLLGSLPFAILATLDTWIPVHIETLFDYHCSNVLVCSGAIYTQDIARVFFRISKRRPNWIVSKRSVSLLLLYIPVMAIVILSASLYQWWLTAIGLLWQGTSALVIVCLVDYKVFRLLKVIQKSNQKTNSNINIRSLILKTVMVTIGMMIDFAYCLLMTPARIRSQQRRFPIYNKHSVPYASILQIICFGFVLSASMPVQKQMVKHNSKITTTIMEPRPTEKTKITHTCPTLSLEKNNTSTKAMSLLLRGPGILDHYQESPLHVPNVTPISDMSLGGTSETNTTIIFVKDTAIKPRSITRFQHDVDPAGINMESPLKSDDFNVSKKDVTFSA